MLVTHKYTHTHRYIHTYTQVHRQGNCSTSSHVVHELCTVPLAIKIRSCFPTFHIQGLMLNFLSDLGKGCLFYLKLDYSVFTQVCLFVHAHVCACICPIDLGSIMVNMNYY